MVSHHVCSIDLTQRWLNWRQECCKTNSRTGHFRPSDFFRGDFYSGEDVFLMFCFELSPDFGFAPRLPGPPWPLFTFFQIHIFRVNTLFLLSPLRPTSRAHKKNLVPTQTLATALRSEGGNKVRVISWRPPFLSLPPSRETADLSPPRSRSPPGARALITAT